MVTRSILLGTTAIAALGLAACNSSNDGFAESAEFFDDFGFEVGEPVGVISATRGQGASVDFGEFTVTFNNSDGSSITIGTPEGEEITFDRDDTDTWIGKDEDLDIELARLTSEDGDRLEVILGAVNVPAETENTVSQANNDDCDFQDGCQDRLVYAAGRLDEVDTFDDGFETYAVAGLLADPANLPRYAEDAFDAERNDEGVCIARCEGDLVEAKVVYHGGFLATVYKDGEVVSDAVTGTYDEETMTGGVTVEIDFGLDTVVFTADGSYLFDDIDDIEPGAVTDLLVTYTDGVVTGVTPLREDISNPLPGQTDTRIVTGLTVVRRPLDPIPPLATAIAPDLNPIISVTPIYGDPITSSNIVTDISVTKSVLPGVAGAEDITVVSDLEFSTATSENSDIYEVHLHGVGGPQDVTFDSGVTYTGDLTPQTYTKTLGDYQVSGSYVEVPVNSGLDKLGLPVDGEFGGAVFGPGQEVFDVLDNPEGEYTPTDSDLINVTATAGVFEANSDLGGDESVGPTVEIIGAFGADPDPSNGP